ncbi:MAG: protein BatD [Bdellovibrionales bacterium]|nr:protein BatD [Bdellovibrionales bacterium]
MSVQFCKWFSQLSIGFLCFAAVMPALADDIKVFATIDRNQMRVGDTFTYKVTVSSSGTLAAGAPSLPSLADFDMLNSWTSQQSQSVLANGKFEVTQSRIFNYMLAPKKEGRLTIQGATVIAGNKTYVTKPIQVTVSKSAGPGRRAQPRTPPGQPQDPFQAMEDAFADLLNRGMDDGFQSQPTNHNEAFFIQVDVDKTEAYVGEQITVSWYLYTRGQIRDIDTLKYPSLNGFWKEEIQLATRLNFEREIVNGIPYQKALLASFALFPIKEGTAKIDPYKAKCTVLKPSRFGFGRPFQATKISKTVKVKVKALPADTQPKDFSGAVGNYKVSSALDTQTTTVNQPVTLKIRFEGQGNAKLIDLPYLELPESFEEYDSKNDSKYFRNGQSYKEFEVLMIPREPGQFVIPQASVSMFNPKTGEYYQAQTDEHKIEILPGKGQDVIPSSPLAKAEQAEQDPSPKLLLDYGASASTGASQRMGIWLGLYLFSFSLLFWRAYREFGWGRSEKDLEELLGKRVQVLKTALKQNDFRAVGVGGMNCLYSVLGEVSGQGGANQELEKLLQKSPPSVRRDFSEDLEKLLKYFETLSFAPEEVIGPLKEPKIMKEQIAELENVLSKAIHIAIKSLGEVG